MACVKFQINSNTLYLRCALSPNLSGAESRIPAHYKSGPAHLAVSADPLFIIGGSKLSCLHFRPSSTELNVVSRDMKVVVSCAVLSSVTAPLCKAFCSTRAMSVLVVSASTSAIDTCFLLFLPIVISSAFYASTTAFGGVTSIVTA